MLYNQRCRPNLSTGNMTSAPGISHAGHRRYKCRSVDTYCLGYCITFTVFISTYIIWFRALPAKNKFCYVRQSRFYHHSLFITIRFYLVTRLTRTEASYPIPTDPR